MRIFVKSLESNSVAYDVEPCGKIATLKSLIEEKQRIPVDSQRLIFASCNLEDQYALADYGINASSTVHLTLSLLGGGKKRKKKTYTTPKKTKHKRKKVKLAVLKYYKVDESGKISRLRKECASVTCGGGVFMASHQNRYYCGKCYYTLVMAEKEKGGAKK